MVMVDKNGIRIQIDRKENQSVVYCCGDRVSQWLQELFPCIVELVGVSVSCKLVLESVNNPNVPVITCNDQPEETICSKIADVFLKSHSSGCVQSPVQEIEECKNDVLTPSTSDKISRCTNARYLIVPSLGSYSYT